MIPIRVLHVVTQMNRNGLESRIMDIYRNIDRTRVQYDFLTHRKTAGHFDDEIKSLGGNVYYLDPIRPQKIFSYLSQLNQFFQEHPYKIVHAHLNSYCTWVLSAAKRAGVPIRIAHSRNSGMDHDWKAVFKFASKLFVNNYTTHKFACSHQAGVWLFGKKGVQAPNLFKVIPNAFDLRKFSFSNEARASMRAELKLAEGDTAIVHVGRLSFQKNHEFLLRVFSELLKKKPHAKLFLIGEGELHDIIQQKTGQMKLQDKVMFLGNQKDVGRYLQAMDLMIFPSVYEGFGTVVIESQCSGLPTLVSDVLPPETKVTECIAYLSLNESAAGWAEKALDMINSIQRSDHTEQLGDAGYDIQKSYLFMENFYIDALNQSSHI